MHTNFILFLGLIIKITKNFMFSIYFQVYLYVYKVKVCKCCDIGQINVEFDWASRQCSGLYPVVCLAPKDLYYT